MNVKKKHFSKDAAKQDELLDSLKGVLRNMEHSEGNTPPS